MNLPKQFDHNDVKILSEKTVYEGFFRMKKYHLQFRRFQGDWSVEVGRECFERGAVCAALLYDPQKDAVVLCEQFRVGCLEDEKTAWQYELVAGIIEKNETPEITLKREAIEEANSEIQTLIPIVEYYSTPGGSSEKMHLFCAHVDSSKIEGIHGNDHEGENIRLHVLPRKEAYSLLQNGRIRNAAAIIALQWLELKGK